MNTCDLAGQRALCVSAECRFGDCAGVNGHGFCQPRYACCGLVGTTITVGPSTSSAFENSRASFSQLSTFTVRHPNPDAREAMSSPGRSKPGTPGVSSSTADDLGIEYSPLRMTTNTIGSRCWAAV